MKLADHFDVTCSSCGKRQCHPTADLIASRSTCVNCGRVLDDVRLKVRDASESISRQQAYVLEPLIDLEELLGVPFPDAAGWDKIETKADYVRCVVSFLTLVAPDKADAELISQAFDRSLVTRGRSVPASDTSPLH